LTFIIIFDNIGKFEASNCFEWFLHSRKGIRAVMVSNAKAVAIVCLENPVESGQNPWALAKLGEEMEREEIGFVIAETRVEALKKHLFRVDAPKIIIYVGAELLFAAQQAIKKSSDLRAVVFIRGIEKPTTFSKRLMILPKSGDGILELFRLIRSQNLSK